MAWQTRIQDIFQIGLVINTRLLGFVFFIMSDRLEKEQKTWCDALRVSFLCQVLTRGIGREVGRSSVKNYPVSSLGNSKQWLPYIFGLPAFFVCWLFPSSMHVSTPTSIACQLNSKTTLWWYLLSFRLLLSFSSCLQNICKRNAFSM